MESFKGKGDGYIIRTGKQYSILDIAKMFTKQKYRFIDEQKGNREESSGDYAKMLKLGWKPQHDIRDYIENSKIIRY